MCYGVDNIEYTTAVKYGLGDLFKKMLRLNVEKATR